MSENETSPLRDRLSAVIRSRAAAQTDWLETLASFESTRGNEAPCQDWLADEFAARGWAVDKYRLGDLDMAGLPGFSPVAEANYAEAIEVVAQPLAGIGGRSLILQGHIDVVPPGPREQWAHDPFAPEIHNGFMSGRGVSDMKAGVTEMVFALDALAALGVAPAGQVFVETVTEEECTGNGALSTLARGYLADACLIPEPVNGQLLRAQLGSVWFRVRVAGRSAHVLETQLGENAILATYDYIAALQKLAAETSASAIGSPWFGHLPEVIKLSVGKIRGGDWIGMVPSWCEIDCRLGVLPGQDLAEIRQSIIKRVAATARDRNAAAPEVSWIGFQAEAYVLEPGSDAEAVLAAAHTAVTGEALESFSQPATSDVRQYGLYYGMPALCYGSKGQGLHSPTERADLESMLETTTVIALFIAEWCGLVPANQAQGS